MPLRTIAVVFALLAFSPMTLACSSADASLANGDDAGGAPAPVIADAGLASDAQGAKASDARSPRTPDAQSTADASKPSSSPTFACWGNGKPDPAAVVRAGFQWFESGYPGTLSASDNQILAAGGVVPIAYINMSEVPNDDAYLQGQIGAFWKSIPLCQNTQWNTTVVDVRDARWQDWLFRRANDAYALGNRGIKWDVAAVESLCKSWNGDAAKAQAAVDAMAGVLAKVRAAHPDMIFIVNQGFALTTQHASLIDGFEEENLMNYVDANPNDGWGKDQVTALDGIHARGIPILDLEYVDLFACKDPSCAKATSLIAEVAKHDWVPYVTNTSLNIEGRGLHIAPPW